MFAKLKNKQAIKKGIFTLFLLLSLTPFQVFAADVVDEAVEALEGTVQVNASQRTGFIKDVSATPTAAEIVGLVIKIALGILGLVFFILIIYGGIIWMTAGGNESKAERATKILSQASVGIIIVVSAYLFTNVIIFRFIDALTS